MRVSQVELPGNIEMQMSRNSPHGLYRVYRARRGSPEVVITDEESSGKVLKKKPRKNAALLLFFFLNLFRF